LSLSRGPAARQGPERTCIGCRRREAKPALLRVARAGDGTVVVDPAGRTPGRGAYVHRDLGCVDLALAHGRLFRALRAEADRSAAARLRRDIEGMLTA
jgi:predicted RNA-binding protein YlxR (DUF448 family)